MSFLGLVCVCFLLTLSTATIQEDKSKLIKLKLNKKILKEALEELDIMEIANMNLDDWWKAGRGFQDTIGFGFIHNLEKSRGKALSLKGLSFVIFLNVDDFDNVAQRIMSLNLPEVAVIACWKWSPRIVLWRTVRSIIPVFLLVLWSSPSLLQNGLDTISKGTKQVKTKTKKALQYIKDTFDDGVKALTQNAPNSDDNNSNSPTSAKEAKSLAMTLPDPNKCQHCNGRSCVEEPVRKCRGCR